MNVATEYARNVYECFEVETDILFFKVGTLGLIIFHGRNYNIKKKLSIEQLQVITQSGKFIKVSGDCYVNTSKILSFVDGRINFNQSGSSSKQLPVSKWRQSHIRALLSSRKTIAV